MSDDSPEARFAAGRAFLDEHRLRYIASKGVEGHILDLRANGGRRYAPQLLLRYTGRRSGQTYITPLQYGTIGGELVVVASKNGAKDNPLWFENVIAGGPVAVQVGTQAFAATWRVPEGEEREEYWRFVCRNNPAYARYQSQTERRIPVLVLEPGEDIAVFVEP